MTKKKTKTTKTEAMEQTVEAPPESSAAQKLDGLIRAKAHSLAQTAIAEMWAFIEKPDKGEFDPEVLELLARKEIGKPRSTLEGDLVGPLLRAVDYAMRSKVRPKTASIPRTPVATVNRATGFASHATEQSKPHDADLLAERLLKATSGKKK